MDAIVEKLETKLHEWDTETARQVRELVAKIIQLADDNTVGVGRSLSVEQEVLDMLDEPSSW